MMLSRCGVRISYALYLLVLGAFFSPSVLQSRQWDTQKATQAFQEAAEKKSALKQATEPLLSQYIECAQTYRKVYLSDPHYRHAGDAIYEEGVLYQQIGDKFGRPEHYQTSLKRLKLLVTDYEGNPNSPDALLRMAAIYANSLKDDAAAQEAYDRLMSRYKYSKAAIERIRAQNATKPSPIPETPATGDLPKTNPAVPAELQSIRYWVSSDSLRVTMDLDGIVSYQKARLSHPDRIYFDLSGVKISRNLRSRTIAVGAEHLSRIRISQNTPTTVRVVFDVSSISTYSVTELQAPFRLNLDLRYPVTENKALAEAKEIRQPPLETSSVKPEVPPDSSGSSATAIGTPAPTGESGPIAVPPANASKMRSAPKAITELRRPEPAAVDKNSSSAPRTAPASVPLPASASVSNSEEEDKKPAIKSPIARDIPAVPKAAPATSHGDRTLTRMLGLKIGRIVLDPGHGGHDLGTIGPKGVYEKNVVLSLALELKALIQEELGAEVFLTRSDDTFVSLEERTALANQHRADLFISIHVNSSTIRSISGVETYYLDFAKTNAEREIAARENSTSSTTISDLEDLIKKIAKADKSAESRELASIMQASLFSGARKLFPSAQNRGVRSAPFVVLIGANMPSILAEVAFISNPKDERLLNRKANQKALAKALYSGIVGYMETLGSEMVHNQINTK